MKAIGKNIIIEVEKEAPVASLNGLDLTVTQADDDRVNAKVISVGSKVEDPSIVDGCRVLLFKNKLCNISPTESVTDEEQIIGIL